MLHDISHLIGILGNIEYRRALILASKKIVQNGWKINTDQSTDDAPLGERFYWCFERMTTVKTENRTELEKFITKDLSLIIKKNAVNTVGDFENQLDKLGADKTRQMAENVLTGLPKFMLLLGAIPIDGFPAPQA